MKYNKCRTVADVKADPRVTEFRKRPSTRKFSYDDSFWVGMINGEWMTSSRIKDFCEVLNKNLDPQILRF